MSHIPTTAPQRLLIIDIDGLRQDVFHQALERNGIPNLARLLGDSPVHLNPVSTFPSITFCAQTSIFTGAHPDRHGITGNQFFDRFGQRNGGTPRFYAFDVGDALAYNDAVLTFTGPLGLLGQTVDPQVPTLYERAAKAGRRSAVIYHMLSRGAERWVSPSLIDIARFTKGGSLFGLNAEQYDRGMIEAALKYLRSEEAPDILTVYFMGLDHTSHHDGPGAQMDYLTRVVDPLLGRLLAELEGRGLLTNTLALVVSDHGQIEVVEDDRHSLRLSVPFDREMGDLFDALGLDVHDLPGEGHNCEAVVASNGGMAHVYLRKRHGPWGTFPDFQRDVLPVGLAFWHANLTGAYSKDLQGALSMVLARNGEAQGWEAKYQALTPEGQLIPVEAYIAGHPEIHAVDAVARLRHLSGPLSGDLLLVSNYHEGFYFGAPTVGVHGGLHYEDSWSVGSLGWLGASAEQQTALRNLLEKRTDERQANEGREHPNLVDLAPLIAELFGWPD